jgi:hypothetical protein
VLVVCCGAVAVELCRCDYAMSNLSTSSRLKGLVPSTTLSERWYFINLLLSGLLVADIFQSIGRLCVAYPINDPEYAFVKVESWV